MRSTRLLALVLVAAAACGSSKSTGVGASDVTAFDQAGLEVATSVASYRSAATTMGSAAECAAAVQQYSQGVHPGVDRMGQMASRMDDYLSSRGQMTAADVQCGTTVMSSELAQHTALACTLPDMASNRAEALRHCDAMERFSDHMRMRAAEMGSMMGASGSGAGPAMMDGGWVMPDGGMMGFGDDMPGCTFADGGFHTDGGYPADGGWMMDGGAGHSDAGVPMMDGGMMGALMNP